MRRGLGRCHLLDSVEAGLCFILNVWVMNRRCILIGPLILAVSLPHLLAVEKGYQTVTIIDVQQKARTRVLYYLVNTPVTQDDPFYQVAVQLRDTVWVGEFTPRHAGDPLPESWKAGATLQARFEKHAMFVKRSDGGELQLTILKHMPASKYH